MKDIKEVIDIIKLHYPNSSARIEDYQLLSNDIIMLTGNGGKKVIYRLDDDNLFVYKDEKVLDKSEVSKWKSIIREVKLISLGV